MSYPNPQQTAPQHQRYVGLYYYSKYWRQWDQVIGFKGMMWVVQSVDLNGQPVGEVRKHCTPLWARQFADKPFDVQFFDLY